MTKARKANPLDTCAECGKLQSHSHHATKHVFVRRGMNRSRIPQPTAKPVVLTAADWHFLADSARIFAGDEFLRHPLSKKIGKDGQRAAERGVAPAKEAK